MKINTADLVQDTTHSTGTGDITLDRVAQPQQFLFDTIFAVGTSNIPYRRYVDLPGTDTETGLGTLTSTTTFRRDVVLQSSNGNALVNFGAGKQNIICTVNASEFNKLVTSEDIPFSTAVPLNTGGNAYMPQQNVTAALAFSVAGSTIKNSVVYVRLVADGTHGITFSGMLESTGSSGYDNRPGIVNMLAVWYDGYDVLYSISQVVGAVPADITAPTAASAAVANATPTTVTITMSEAMDAGNVPAASAFVVGGHTVTAVGISGSAISLTVSAGFTNGETARTVSYAQPGTNNARDVAGNLLANFTSLAITNNVQPVDVTAPTFGSAAVANATPAVINITMSETLAATTPATSAFAVSGGKTVTGVTISGAVINLAVSAPYANGDTITVTYTKPGTNAIQDPSGNQTASFGPASVTNNIGASSTVRLNRSVANCTESTSAPWLYTGNGTGATGGTVGAVSAVTKASGVNGSATFKVNTLDSDFMVQFGTTAGVDAYQNNDCIWSAGGTQYKVIPTGGTVITPGTAVAPALGDLLRFSHTDANTAADFAVTTLYQVSKDNGSTWTTLYSAASGRLLTYYAKAVPGGVSALSCVATVGFA